MTDVLIVRPEGDDVERELSRWSNRFVRRLEKHPFVDLHGDGCTRAAVDGALRPNQLVVYWGHGERDCLGNPPLLDVENIGRCNGAIVVATACYSATELGPAAVGSGVQAYLGYTTKLPVMKDPHRLGYLAADALYRLVEGASVDEGLPVLDARLSDFATASVAHPPRKVARRVPEWLVAVSLRDGLTILPEEHGGGARLAP